MFKCIIVAVVLLISVSSQSCNITGTPIPITSAYSSLSTSNFTLTINQNTAVGQWFAPSANQTVVVTIGGWSSSNGSLIQLSVAGNASAVTASIGYGQQGVIYTSVVGNYIYNFAQKDDANSNFKIQLTSQVTKTGNASTDVTFALVQRGYNGNNGTCFNTCPFGTGVQFYQNNGTTNPNQFICWEPKLLITICLIVLAFLI